MTSTTLGWLLVSLLGGGLAAHADSAAQCHRAVDRALGLQPPEVKSPSCSPLDPACGSLKNAASAIGNMQRRKNEKDPLKRSLSEECRPKVEDRCATYARLVAEGWTEDDAWSRSMNGCSKSMDDVSFTFPDCICRHVLDVEKCTKPAPATPPDVVPRKQL